MKENKLEEIRTLFDNIRSLVENAADFSNGNTAQGKDEGDVYGWEMWDKYMEQAKELGLTEFNRLENKIKEKLEN